MSVAIHESRGEEAMFLFCQRKKPGKVGNEKKKKGSNRSLTGNLVPKLSNGGPI